MKTPSLLTTALVAALAFSQPTLADPRPNHFEGKPAETLEQAVANFSQYNDELAAILTEDTLDAKALHEVHQLTYTLENALEKINAEFTTLAETLEAVHVASETADEKTVKSQGKQYLETAKKIVK